MSRAPVGWAVAMGALTMLLLGGTAWAEPKKGATIECKMSKFKHNRGQALLGLFKKGQGFPTKLKKATARGKTKIKKRKATYKFKNVKPGVWAIAVFHDENGNGKFDTNFLGMPKEGYGGSRNPKSRFSPPDFEDGCFTVKKGDRAFKIFMDYP